MVASQVAGKIAELYVFSELLKRGAVPFFPLVDEGVDAVVRNPAGRFVELQIRSAGSLGGKRPSWFQMTTVPPGKNFFIIGVEFADGEPLDAWVFPAMIFKKYASGPVNGSARVLNLDTGIRKYGIALKDPLCGFRNRRELITNYEQFEALLESPEDLEDVLTMKEAMEAPEEESFTLEVCERSRSPTLLD